MAGFLNRLLGRAPAPAPSSAAGPDGPIGVAAALDGEAVRAEFEAFCAGFCFRPRKNLIKFLKANDLGRVIKWLDPSTPEPEPKAIVRFGVEAMRLGVNLWEQPGLTLYLKGRGPSQESRDCLSILAQVFDKPIKLIVELEPEEPLQVLLFNPR